MAMASPNVVTVWVPLQRTPPEMGSLAFAPPPPAGHDAWTETYATPEVYEWLLSHRLSDRE